MKRDVIYLHYLDRELYRGLATSDDRIDSLMESALKVTWLSSYEILASSIALVWEGYQNYPKTSKIVVELLKRDDMKLISAFPTVDEFVDSNQTLYRDDRKRYPVYFSDMPTNLMEFQPSILKESSTTNVIENKLNCWIDTGNSELFRTKLDNSLLRNTGNMIKQTLLEREGRAITLSLFKDGVQNIHYRNQLARNLSIAHIDHYLNEIHGDLVTGIAGLTVYDNLACEFPLHDIVICREIIASCDWRVLDDSCFLELLQYSDCRYKTQFDLCMRSIITTLYETYAEENWSAEWVRNILVKKIREAGACLFRQESMGLSWDKLLYEINEMDRYFINSDIHYRILREEKVNMKKVLLICTATDAETDAAIKRAMSYGLHAEPEKVDNKQVYHLGFLNAIDIYLTQTEMGTERMGSARDKIRDLAKAMMPAYIISTGICFGLKPATAECPDGNNIGDIIVANQIQMYETQKIKEEGDGEIKHIPRGDKAPVSAELLDAFHTAKHLYPQGDKVSFGLLLTGNLLVNSPTVAAKLKEIFLEPVMGDMEAGGIYSACHDKDIKWIAVKGISDWGYDKSDEFQELARSNVYDFLFFTLSKGLI